LAGAPPDGLAGDLIACETVGYHRAVSRVQRHARVVEPTPDSFPRPWVVVDEAAVFREVKVDPLTGPGPRHVGRAADGGRAAADDDHRTGCGQAIVGGAQVCADFRV
jgi:hypothetical protein